MTEARSKRGAIRMVLDHAQVRAACQQYVERMFSVTEHRIEVVTGASEAIVTITKRRQRKAKGAA